jgi:serine/threonine protein kinase/tetratricopeptide (TPR) repeat protein
MSSTAHDSSVDALVERLADELSRRWHEGERPLVEEYFNRHSELRDFPEAAAELIYEEICLRQEYGESAASEDVLSRFPQWQTQLRVLLDCHELMQAGAAAPSFPEVGETLGEFRLEAELGRGKQGRVFLARQSALADRPIVLKLVPLLGREHLLLARMQHTHIVPLYFVQDFPERMLLALGMPYFGGAALNNVLESLQGIPLARRSGRLVLEAVRQAQSASPVALPVRGPGCQVLERASYVDSVCWIGVCLAEALQYAHERGVLHLDLKPANVLLAADGQPMLLDFHLARPPLAPDARPPEWLGGTPAYMAPEQLAAWKSVRDGRPIITALDGRADIFALGALLHEMLSGIRPDAENSQRPELPAVNPLVSRGLADIINKCLEADAKTRYVDAAALADDLRRHWRSLPLRGVANHSLRERWLKWRKRRPNALWLLVVLLVCLLITGIGFGHVSRRLDQARTALSEARGYIEQRDFQRATTTLEFGIAAAELAPFSDSLKRELQEQLRTVQDLQAGREFHLVVERLRLFEGADSPRGKDAQALINLCASFWHDRDRIAALTQDKPEWRQDLLDLAILWTRLRVRMATAQQRPAIRDETLDLLAEAERMCGPSCVLWHERQQHATALGRKAAAKQAADQGALLSPRTAWEHAALGRALLDDGDLNAAANHLDRALKLKPDDFWTSYHMGRCARLLGRQDESITAFSVCLALSPQSAWCYHNRALAFADNEKLDRARSDFDRALELDAHLADASLQRGLLNYREKKLDAALDDLNRALADGAAEAKVRHGRALVYLARGDQAAATAELHEALRVDPDHKPARVLLERLRGPG